MTDEKVDCIVTYMPHSDVVQLAKHTPRPVRGVTQTTDGRVLIFPSPPPPGTDGNHDRHRLREWVPAGRTLHIVDIENLVGNPRATCPEMALTRAQHRRVSRWASGDHTIVACNEKAVFNAKLVYPEATVRIGYGRDGADRALLREVADYDDISGRFERVTVGSGDGVFADLVIELRRRGVTVEVIGVRGATSNRLAAAASQVYWMPTRVPRIVQESEASDVTPRDAA